MELRRHEEISQISRYWTPDHLDVTHVPMTYARPKATWIDGYQRLRPRVTSDSTERLARRRMSSHAVVDPAEITILPALQPARPAPPALGVAPRASARSRFFARVSALVGHLPAR